MTKKSSKQKTIRVFDPQSSSSSSLENSVPADKASKSSTQVPSQTQSPEPLSGELLPTQHETQPLEDDLLSDSTGIDPLSPDQMDSDSLFKSERALDAQETTPNESQETLESRSSETVDQDMPDLLSNQGSRPYHLLMIPPEGSPLSEPYESLADVLVAIRRHSQAPILMDEIDLWAVYVFASPPLQLLGDIRTGSIAIQENGVTTQMTGEDLPLLNPGSFTPVVSSESTKNDIGEGSLGFDMFDDEHRLF